MYRIPGYFLVAALSVMMFTACSDDDGPAQPAQPVTHDGQSKALGEGQVTAYERVDADGNLLAVGVRFTEGTLAGLPDDDTQVALELPKMVANSPFDHVGFDWTRHGHFPEPIYGTPHFDIHFYVVDQQTLATVEPGPDAVWPDPQYLPQDYVSTMDAVPYMGTHYLDTLAAELHGAPFDKTHIYGFYRGDLFFFEPMITKAYFETKPNVTVDIKQPAAFSPSGKVYPRQYTISYDADRKEYAVELTSMQLH